MKVLKNRGPTLSSLGVRTAYAALADNVISAEERRALGFDDYLSKPFKSKIMLALVAKCMARRLAAHKEAR